MGFRKWAAVLPVHTQAHLVEEILNQQTIVWAAHLFSYCQ